MAKCSRVNFNSKTHNHRVQLIYFDCLYARIRTGEGEGGDGIKYRENEKKSGSPRGEIEEGKGSGGEEKELIDTYV